MPSYDYRCEPCKKTFEVQQSIKNVARTVPCARCGKDCERYFGNTVFGIGLCDTSYNAGFCNGNQFANDPETGEIYAAKARWAGVSIKGKVYRNALARTPGDPQAWVSDLSEAKDVCRRNGWRYKVEGGVLQCEGDLDLGQS